MVTLYRQFRERRLLKASMENTPQKKKSKRKRAQAFYPMPMPSMSDTVDEDSISPTTSDDEAYDTDEDGYIRTLVSGDFALLNMLALADTDANFFRRMTAIL